MRIWLRHNFRFYIAFQQFFDTYSKKKIEKMKKKKKESKGGKLKTITKQYDNVVPPTRSYEKKVEKNVNIFLSPSSL